MQEHDPLVRECSPAGISKARDLFERALTATGLHVSQGNNIWEAYREFEQAIFHTIDVTDIQVKENFHHSTVIILLEQYYVILIIFIIKSFKMSKNRLGQRYKLLFKVPLISSSLIL